jgi:hypothetical protein
MVYREARLFCIITTTHVYRTQKRVKRFPGKTQEKQSRPSRPSYASPALDTTNLPLEQATIAPFPSRAASGARWLRSSQDLGQVADRPRGPNTAFEEIRARQLPVAPHFLQRDFWLACRLAFRLVGRFRSSQVVSEYAVIQAQSWHGCIRPLAHVQREKRPSATNSASKKQWRAWRATRGGAPGSQPPAA